MELNQALFSYIYGLAHQNDVLDALFAFLATDFGLLAVFAMLYFLYTHEDKRRGLRELSIVMGSAVAAWGVAHVIKYYFPAARPDTLIDAVKPLFAHGNGIDSFPSGHASFFGALATAAWLYHKNIGYSIALIALLVGFARVASGIHMPFDILAGYVLGAAVASAVYLLMRRTG